MTDSHKKCKTSRNKGKNGELELMHILRDDYGYPVRRGYVFQHESDLVGLQGIHPEVKRKEKLSIYEAMEQAVEEAQKRDDGLPTVFHRRNGKEWLVVMRLSDWIDLYGAWVDGEQRMGKTSQEDAKESDRM